MRPLPLHPLHPLHGISPGPALGGAGAANIAAFGGTRFAVCQWFEERLCGLAWAARLLA